MGDVLKITKDKRHRSSSSLAGVALEGTRSERKLDVRPSIPEVEDQYALADARCDDLQQKIDLVKALKRKRKLKKRSMTKVVETLPSEVPFISVRTQPKKKVSQQANARVRRLEVPPNPTRGYLDPATVEQHRMLGHVRTYGHNYKQPNQEQSKEITPGQKPYKLRVDRIRPDGDGSMYQSVQVSRNADALEVACGQDEAIGEFSDSEQYDQGQEGFSLVNRSKPMDRLQVKSGRRKCATRDNTKDVPKWTDKTDSESKSGFRCISSPTYRRRQQYRQQAQQNPVKNQPEERPVVELFSMHRASPPAVQRRQVASPSSFDKRTKKVSRESNYDNVATGPLEDVASVESKKELHRPARRIKYRSRRYELPTVASQMKQAGMRYYYGNNNQSNIPFVVSKSTAPSHNIGVNIQQVLNGLKIQQPLSGIPLTIAHHMGLGHVPMYTRTKSATNQRVSLDNREINVIKLGPRLLRLPSYKYMSYSRLLSLYREGEGMVPRFLRAISRPHYFYTSMYNLATNREEDAATSKGRATSQGAKQSLAEYASLYREYEQVNKSLMEGKFDPDLARRKDELSRELAAREEHIRKVVQEYKPPGEDEHTLRASNSVGEDAYHSTFKLNVSEQ